MNIIICSFFANLSRDKYTIIDFKKQFFLWFSGVRGAMAFALAIKSKFDFPGVGSMFLLLTLIITAFTFIYSSFLLEDTLYKCGIIILEEDIDSSEKFPNTEKDNFGKIKEMMYNLHAGFLIPFAARKPSLEEQNPLRRSLNEDFNKCS